MTYSDIYLIEDYYVVGGGEVLQLVGDEDDGPGPQVAADAAAEQVAPHRAVHGAQRVVQQHHVRVQVHRPGGGGPVLSD